MSGVILKTKFHVILIALKLNEIKILEKKYLFAFFSCIARDLFFLLISLFLETLNFNSFHLKSHIKKILEV
jgi:hypothetical protein